MRDRAPRWRWERPWGRKDRTVCQHARRLLGEGIQHPGALTRLPEGERREGPLWVALGREALRTGKRGRLKKTLRKGVTVRRKHKGSPRPKRGPKRPTYPAPSPGPPDTAQSMATKERQAQHREAFHPSLRRRWAAYRRRPNR